MPRVSVVLTTYNRAGLLSSTIEGVLAQTYGDFELLLMDDCSTDETPQIARRYEKQDSRVVYVRHSKNLGMPGNLNAGLKLAAGEYIANLHDGDVYSQHLLERWSSALDRHPNAAFVFNAYRHVDECHEERFVETLDLPEAVPGRILIETLYFRRWHFGSPVWGTVMARRAAYEQEGVFDSRFGFVADVDMWMRLAEKFEVVYINEPLISLPSKKAVPREITVTSLSTLTTLQHMFYEARLRHYRNDFYRRIAEVARHFCYCGMAMPAYLAVHIKRKIDVAIGRRKRL